MRRIKKLKPKLAYCAILGFCSEPFPPVFSFHWFLVFAGHIRLSFTFRVIAN